MTNSEMPPPLAGALDATGQGADQHSTGYAVGAPVYQAAGWRGVIPVDPADKGGVPKGFTGRAGTDVTPETLAWFVKSKPGHNVGLRLPADLIGIDVDAYDSKTGGRTFEVAQQRWGPLPPSYRSTSRDDGVSGIRLYRIPAGIELPDTIEFKDLDIGDIEIVQRHHRHVQCWPSRHPKTGRLYRWIDELDGSVMDNPPAPGDPPDLPPKWLEALQELKPQRANNVESAPAGAPVDVRAALTEGSQSARVGARLSTAINDCHGPSRYEHLRGNVLALLRHGHEGDSGVKPALETLCKVYVTAVGPDRPGSHPAAWREFWRLVYGDRVADLLAEPSNMDWADHIPPEGIGLSATGQGGIVQGGHQAPPPTQDGAGPAPATTWEPMDLGPYLRGEIEQPEPSIGITRTDGMSVLYPGREHAVLGETESGKTWFVLECAAVEMRKGRHVVYVHYEEPDPASTVERLRMLDVTDDVMSERLHFVAPGRRLEHPQWLDDLLTTGPSLVVHDGINEGMTVNGFDINLEGWSMFRRALVTPCLRAGAAVVGCDHVPMVKDGTRRDAFGTVHKGNALNGARFHLENVEPFGKGLRGRSNVYVTKDRPGSLRVRGKPPTKVGGKTLLGTLVVDSADPFLPPSLTLYAPREDDGTSAKALEAAGRLDELGERVFKVVAKAPGGAVGSRTELFDAFREAGHEARDKNIVDAAEDLIVAGRLVEIRNGQRIGYRVTSARGDEK